MINNIITKGLKITGKALETRQDALDKMYKIIRDVEEYKIPKENRRVKFMINYIGENSGPRNIYKTFMEYKTLCDYIDSGFHILSVDDISIKPTQFGKYIPDLKLAFRLVSEINKCSNHNIWIDAEDYSFLWYQKDLVFELKETFPNTQFGLCIQLKQDKFLELTEICFKNEIKVRLCKGAYPVKPKLDSSELFRRAIKVIALSKDTPQLLEIATIRDYSFVNLALKNKLGLQVLYGWHKPLLNYPYGLRIYVPYGTNWVPYIKRRMREYIGK